MAVDYQKTVEKAELVKSLESALLRAEEYGNTQVCECINGALGLLMLKDKKTASSILANTNAKIVLAPEEANNSTIFYSIVGGGRVVVRNSQRGIANTYVAVHHDFPPIGADKNKTEENTLDMIYTSDLTKLQHWADVWAGKKVNLKIGGTDAVIRRGKIVDIALSDIFPTSQKKNKSSIDKKTE